MRCEQRTRVEYKKARSDGSRFLQFFAFL